ncbi:MAG: tetratricopeptide repeat protein [Methylococcales bacterium]
MMKRFLWLLVLGFFFLCEPTLAAKKAVISPRLFENLQKIELLITDKAYKEALTQLGGLTETLKKGTYEEAVVLRLKASVYIQNEQYPKAIKILLQCKQLEVLPDNQEQQLLINLGQLYLAEGQYQKAIDLIEVWLKDNPNPSPGINALTASAYAQLKYYNKALNFISKAVEAAKEPVEGWLKLKLALHFQLQQYPPAATVLEQLVRLYPDKKVYWTQLSGVYIQLKDYKKSLSVKHLAYQRGLITKSKEIVSIAHLFLFNEAPLKAAVLLEAALNKKEVRHTAKNWELLANAWTLSQEGDQAIAALEIASKLADTGKLYKQLGHSYVENEQWNKAVGALTKALKKGAIKRKGDTYILLGMSYFELKDYPKATEAFKKAKEQKNKKLKKTAQQWIDYLASFEQL